jgi:hypothetical protein
MDDFPADTPQNNFEHMWNFTRETFTFFEYKHINWDSIKIVYQNRIYGDMSDDSLFSVLSEMTDVLKDGHSSLQSDLKKHQYYFFLDRPTNFNYDLLLRNYFQLNKAEYIGPFVVMELGNLGYIYYGSFMDDFTDEQLDYIFKNFREKRGIVFDMRNNTGGAVDNIGKIVGRFTDEEVLAGYNQFKSGPGPEDLTEKVSFYVHPDGNVRYTGPVAVLTNRVIYSAAHFTAVHFRALTNVILIGDRTGGGGGIPSYTELPNGWIFRCSASIQTTPDGVITEGGIEPDIYETMDSQGEGKDGILERAIEQLNQPGLGEN